MHERERIWVKFQRFTAKGTPIEALEARATNWRVVRVVLDRKVLDEAVVHANLALVQRHRRVDASLGRQPGGTKVEEDELVGGTRRRRRSQAPQARPDVMRPAHVVPLGGRHFLAIFNFYCSHQFFLVLDAVCAARFARSTTQCTCCTTGESCPDSGLSLAIVMAYRLLQPTANNPGDTTT